MKSLAEIISEIEIFFSSKEDEFCMKECILLILD